MVIVASYVYPITQRENLKKIQNFFENFARKYPNDFGFFKSPPDPEKPAIYSKFKSFLNGKERFIDELLEKVLAKKAGKSLQNRYVELENLTPQDFSKFIHRFCIDNFFNISRRSRSKGYHKIRQRIIKKEVNLSNKNLRAVPSGILEAKTARDVISIQLDSNQLTSLPPGIKNLTSLYSLNLTKNLLNFLPDEISGLKVLSLLELQKNRLTSLPESLRALISLEIVELHDNKLTSLPDSLRGLISVETLSLFNNQLTSLPSEIGALTTLKELDLSFNKLTSLPSEIGALTALKKLDLSLNRLSSLPIQLERLENLNELNLIGHSFTFAPLAILRLSKLEKIRILGCDKYISCEDEKKLQEKNESKT